jgi:Tfp pilus assembly protein PilO
MIRDIILIVLILAFIGVVIFLDVPGVQGVLQLRKDIEMQKQILLDKQDFLATVKELSGAYKKNKENIDKINFILPLKEDIPNLLVQVEALVLEQGLVLDKLEVNTPTEEATGRVIDPRDLSAGQGTANTKYKTLTIDLAFTGDYSALKNFLKATEENMRLIDIDSIGISPESEASGIFKFILSLKTYYQE